MPPVAQKYITNIAILALMVVIFTLPFAMVRAQTEPPATADQEQQAPAAKFVQDLGNKAIGIVQNKNLTQDQRSNQYRTLLHDAFDLNAIGHFVIGRAWNTATPEQQQEYMKLFEELVVKIYGDRLNFYAGEGFKVTTVRQESDKDSVVLSQITHADGSGSTPVDWRVRNDGGKYAIVDVTVDGVSQSVTQRQEYSSIIQRDGGKIDGLLTLMQQRVQAPTTTQK
jgi:phospholipid transport system substrate-binding protein